MSILPLAPNASSERMLELFFTHVKSILNSINKQDFFFLPTSFDNTYEVDILTNSLKRNNEEEYPLFISSFDCYNNIDLITLVKALEQIGYKIKKTINSSINTKLLIYFCPKESGIC